MSDTFNTDIFLWKYNVNVPPLTQDFHFQIFNQQLRSSTVFLSDQKALFCSCMRNLHTKQHVKSHIYCFFIIKQQFWTVLGRNKPVKEMFTFLFSIVQDGRTFPLTLFSALIILVQHNNPCLILQKKYCVVNIRAKTKASVLERIPRICVCVKPDGQGIVVT